MFYQGTVTNQLTGQPIPGVKVTDGRNVVTTDAAGHYELPGWERSHWVGVGILTKAHEDWYAYTAGKEGTYDFAVTPAEESQNLTILHTSDTEIREQTNLEWLDFIREHIEAEKPGLLLHTGDICGRAGMIRHRQVMNYDTMGCPVRYVVGNHDFVPSDADYGEQVFEQLYGPLWWSFDFCGIHCIILSLGHGGRKDMPSGYPREDQWCWLQNDLDLLQAGTKTLVFCHDSGPDPYEFVVGGIDLKQYGLLAWIYGHSHSNMHHVRSGVHNINTGRPESGGIDSSIAGIRKITVEKAQVASKMLYRRFPTAPADTPLWRTNLPGRITFGEPILKDGRIYVGTMRDDYPDRSGIFCLDAADGSILWQFETPGGFHSNLSWDGGLVYGQDCMGNCYCLNGEDGSLVWQRTFRFNEDGFSGGSRTRVPAFVAGNVVLAGSNADVVALDKLTGERLWKAEKPKKAGNTPARPVYDPETDRIYHSGQWGVLRALDRATGEVLWQRTEQPIWYRTQTPCLHEGVIYAGGFDILMKLDATTGETLVEKNIGEGVLELGIPKVESDGQINVCGGPVVDGDILYCPMATAGVLAIDKNTLEVLRRYPASPAAILSAPYVKKGGQTVESRPVILGDTLIFTAADGKVYFYNKNTGEAIKTVNLPAASLVAPIIDGEFFYTADFDGNICKYPL